MRNIAVFTAGVIAISGLLLAQQAPPTTTVPRLVRVSNTFLPADGGKPATLEGVTLSIYRAASEGAPLWQETQNVSVDSEGRYNVLLGATLNDGLPLELFTASEPRWLGVRFNRPGEIEQPRTLLASVPYALRASDAEMLGGFPASAYLHDPSAAGSPGVAAAALANLTPNAPKPRVTSGTAGYIGRFTDATDLGNSVMYQNGSKIGVNDTSPADYLHVAFTDTSGGVTGYAVQNLGNGAASYSGMLFYDQNGSLGQFQGFNNSTHEYRINNIASGGTINFMIGSSSKFQVLNSGDINVNGNLQYGGNVALQLGQFANFNVGLGYGTLSSNTGSDNTATGYNALLSNTSASANTAYGAFAMNGNTTGYQNNAIGYQALFANTTGCCNQVSGAYAEQNNTTGSYNTAEGYAALYSNTTGTDNTAVGYEALYSETTAGGNTATGYEALLANTGCCNQAFGTYALQANTTGNNNAAVGYSALDDNTTGTNNTAVGNGALESNTTGTNNIAIGYLAASGVSGGNSNNIHIGTAGASGDSGTIRIGTLGTQTSFFAAGINGVTTGNNNAVEVMIDSNGQLGTISSSRRYKEDIQDMGDFSHGLMQLRPVTFRYQKPFADGSKPLQYGLIAEEVAEVYPDLVARSAGGQIETVKYQVLDSMLLNEVQRLEKELQELRAQLEHLASRNR